MWYGMTDERYEELLAADCGTRVAAVDEIWSEGIRLREHLKKLNEAQRMVMYGPNNWRYSEGQVDRDDEEYARYLDHLEERGIGITSKHRNG